MLKRNYMSKEALVHLKNYKYGSGEYSIMDKVLTPYWNWVVELLPTWMAPNLVTLSGLLIVMASTFMYLPFDHTLSKSFPPMCYMISALSLFAY